MKEILIRLEDELYEQCKNTKLTGENEGFDFHIIKTVANGTPFEEELKKLWLQIYNIDEHDHDFEGFYHCQNEALELINKRISELKENNNAE